MYMLDCWKCDVGFAQRGIFLAGFLPFAARIRGGWRCNSARVLRAQGGHKVGCEFSSPVETGMFTYYTRLVKRSPSEKESPWLPACANL